MDKRQILVVALVIAAATMAVGLAMLFGGERLTVRDHEFRARPGTMRKTVMPLTSRPETRRAASTATPEESAEDEQATSRKPLPDIVTRFDGEEAPVDTATPGGKVVASARAAVTPEAGAAEIRAYIEEHGDDAEASRLYAELGRLEAQSGAVGAAQANATFDKAVGLAASPEDRHYAALLQARVVVEQNPPAEALKTVEQLLQPQDPVTVSGLQLGLVLGRLYEEAGQGDEAETAYAQVQNQALEAAEALGPEALDAYRLACLRLSRLYRAAGRTTEAETVVRSMKLTLELVPATP